MKFFSRKKPTSPFSTKKKLGLALSGGGARGIAHIGAIRAFEQAGAKFDFITGTSVGSIVGACFAAGKNSYEMEQFVRTLSDKDLLDNRWTKLYNNSEKIATVMHNFLGEVSFSELKIPFKCVAVDIEKGSEVVLSTGDVGLAVAASSSVPLVFKPTIIEGQTLVDGGLMNNIPADICRQMGAQVVVSVDLNSHRGAGTTSLRSLGQIAAVWRIMTSGTAYKGIINSDVIVTPDLKTFSRTTLKNITEMIDEGYRATTEKLDEILQKLNSK